MKIAWIGAGRMTQAFLEGLKAFQDLEHHVSTRSFDKLQALQSRYPIHIHASNQACVLGADLVVLAVKPQQMQAVVEDLQASLPPKAIVVSLAAALSLSQLEAWVPYPIKLARIMPNTAVALRQGSLALCFNTHIEALDLELIHSVFSKVGHVYPIDENLMNPFIATSGSGIAFAYAILDGFIQASVQAGMSQSDAQSLVLETFNAALKMTAASNQPLSSLIDQVCSKGGTTIEGIQVLKNADLVNLFNETFKATIRRAQELSDDLAA